MARVFLNFMPIILLFLSAGCMSLPEGGDEATSLNRSDGSELIYYLDRKGFEGAQPILLLLQGSDCNSIARLGSAPQFARMHPEAALLRIEKRGITRELEYREEADREDCPAAYLRNDSLQQRIDDARLVISKLRETGDWWDEQLFIVGGSSGALVASRLGALVPEVKRVVIFGFGSRWFEEDLLHGLGDGADSSEVLGFFKMMKANPSKEQFASGHSYYYWSEMTRFDQLEVLGAVDVTVLAIQGGRDESVSPKGAREMIAELHRQGRTHVTFKEYDQLDHGFRDEAGVSHLDEVVMFVSDWLGAERTHTP